MSIYTQKSWKVQNDILYVKMCTGAISQWQDYILFSFLLYMLYAFHNGPMLFCSKLKYNFIISEKLSFQLKKIYQKYFKHPKRMTYQEKLNFFP